MTRAIPPQARLLWLAAFLIASPALAKDRSEIRDEGSMFSREAVRKAQSDLAEIDRKYPVAVTVETIESLRGQSINDATERRAEQVDHKGIFVLIAVKDRKLQAIASREVREKLGQDRLVAIRDAFNEQFRAGKPDEGLARGIQAAASALASAYPQQARTIEPPASTLPGPGSSPKVADLGDSPLVARQQVRLTLAGARKVLEGAEAKAASMGQKSNIAVVDDGGHLLAFARMDGGRPASAATSITKATSAATFRQASGPLPGGTMSDELLNLSVQAAASSSGGKFTPLRGGLPIVVDGQVIGAIGVGGGSGEQDVEVAKAGVDAFLAGLQEASKPNGSQAPKSDGPQGTPGSTKPGEPQGSGPAADSRDAPK